MSRETTMNFTKINFEDSLWMEYKTEINQCLGTKWEEKTRSEMIVDANDVGWLRVTWNKESISEEEIILFFTDIFSELLDRKNNIQPVSLNKPNTGISKKVLDIETNVEATTYLFYSTNLSIIQTKDFLYKWRMNNFMNVKIELKPFSQTIGGIIVFLELAGDVFDEVIEAERYSYEDMRKEQDILDFVKRNIKEDHYVNIHIDDYYIPSKDSYLKKHYVHERLIYGYDDDLEVVFAFGFTDNNNLSTYNIKYQDFIYAYEKGKLYYPFGAYYLEDKPWAVETRFVQQPECEYEFNISIFLKKIKEYLDSKEDNIVENIIEKIEVTEEIIAYGTDVYGIVAEVLKIEDPRYDLIDFRVFHLLYEHKKCLMTRMKYLADNNIFDDQLSFYFNQYQQIVNGFMNIRNTYIKQMLREGKNNLLEDTISDKKIKISISETIKNLQSKERMILKEIITIFENH